MLFSFLPHNVISAVFKEWVSDEELMMMDIFIGNKSLKQALDLIYTTPNFVVTTLSDKSEVLKWIAAKQIKVCNVFLGGMDECWTNVNTEKIYSISVQDNLFGDVQKDEKSLVNFINKCPLLSALKVNGSTVAQFADLFSNIDPKILKQLNDLSVEIDNANAEKLSNVTDKIATHCQNLSHLKLHSSKSNIDEAFLIEDVNEILKNNSTWRSVDCQYIHRVDTNNLKLIAQYCPLLEKCIIISSGGVHWNVAEGVTHMLNNLPKIQYIRIFDDMHSAEVCYETKREIIKEQNILSGGFSLSEKQTKSVKFAGVLEKDIRAFFNTFHDFTAIELALFYVPLEEALKVIGQNNSTLEQLVLTRMFSANVPSGLSVALSSILINCKQLHALTFNDLTINEQDFVPLIDMLKEHTGDSLRKLEFNDMKQALNSEMVSFLIVIKCKMSLSNEDRDVVLSAVQNSVK